jgi:hypothetical protein
MTTEPRILFTGPSPRGWHRLQTVLECAQKFAWEYRWGKEGYDEPERVRAVAARVPQHEENKPGLIRGTLLHLGLAHYYARMREKQNGRDPELFLPPEEAIRVFALTKGEPYTLHYEDIIECVKGYIQKHDGADRFKVLHVEELLQADIGGFLFTGRLDLVVEDTRGRVWVFDHKGTGRIESKHREYYSVSGQLLGYRWLAQGAFGEKFAGLRINLVQHGNNDWKYERPQLMQAPELLRQFPQTVVDAENRILELEAQNRPYDQWPKAMNEMTCFGRYGACPHIEKCKWGARGV